jgi:hypothetical protein
VNVKIGLLEALLGNTHLELFDQLGVIIILLMQKHGNKD